MLFQPSGVLRNSVVHAKACRATFVLVRRSCLNSRRSSLTQAKKNVLHKLLRNSQKLLHVGHPEGEPLHDKVLEVESSFKHFEKRVKQRKDNLDKHLTFCENAKQVRSFKYKFKKKICEVLNFNPSSTNS